MGKSDRVERSRECKAANRAGAELVRKIRRAHGALLVGVISELLWFYFTLFLRVNPGGQLYN